MNRSFYFSPIALGLGLLLLASCRTLGGGGTLVLPKLRAGAESPAPTAGLRGVLTRDGDCPRVGGNGNTVVIWPLAPGARSTPGNGNVVVIWPRSATVQQRSGGGGNVIIVWPRAVGGGTPVRVGEPIELIGDMKDDILGLALERPLPPGCTGRVFVAREFRPAPESADGTLHLPKLRPGVTLPGPETRRSGRLVRDGALLRLDDGGGSTVIVWPFAAAIERRGEGIGTVVVIWPRGVGSGTPVRIGDRVELRGIVLVDNLPSRITDCPRDSGCGGPVFVASEVRPVSADTQ
jgi:hypothetical protein